MKRTKSLLEQTQIKNSEPVVISAEGKMLGRLATEVATILRGKDSIHFQPHRLSGRPVIVTHAKSIKVSGNKANQKVYYRHTGYIGNLKSVALKQVLEETPSRAIEAAVYGMLPANRLRRYWMLALSVRDGA